MQFKKSVLFLLLPCFLLFFSCKQKETSSTAKAPDWLNDFPPEDVLWGIGLAKTESDGESILLAEDRARISIARQLSSRVTAYYPNESDGDTNVPGLTAQYTNIDIYYSKVIRQEKDGNGTWWCLIEFPKSHIDLIIEPSPDNDLDILLSNAEELSNMELRKDIIRNVETSTLEWIFTPAQYLPVDMLYGIGAAKLDNDKDSIQLAKERARRSLARSLHTEVKAVFYDLGDNYQEDNSIAGSKYDYSALETNLIHLAKTKDGTWWVLLGSSSLYKAAKEQVLKILTEEEAAYAKFKAEQALRLLDELLLEESEKSKKADE